MHHHKTYMYINFHQNQVKTQVMTVHTSLFAKNRELPKFATTTNIFFNFDSFRYASSNNIHTYQFSAKSGQ